MGKHDRMLCWRCPFLSFSSDLWRKREKKREGARETQREDCQQIEKREKWVNEVTAAAPYQKNKGNKLSRKMYQWIHFMQKKGQQQIYWNPIMERKVNNLYVLLFSRWFWYFRVPASRCTSSLDEYSLFICELWRCLNNRPAFSGTYSTGSETDNIYLLIILHTLSEITDKTIKTNTISNVCIYNLPITDSPRNKIQAHAHVRRYRVCRD